MNTFIFILIFSMGGRGESVVVEFNSQPTCVAHGEVITKNVREAGAAILSSGCFGKGTPPPTTQPQTTPSSSQQQSSATPERK